MIVFHVCIQEGISSFQDYIHVESKLQIEKTNGHIFFSLNKQEHMMIS
jgi:hypothetical protein